MVAGKFSFQGRVFVLGRKPMPWRSTHECLSKKQWYLESLGIEEELETLNSLMIRNETFESEG